jgi:hypothetical protein
MTYLLAAGQCTAPDPSPKSIAKCSLNLTDSGVMTTKATEVARNYHETWNGRDADVLVASFAKDGIFSDSDTTPGINGEALANYVKGVWKAIPDFSIELLIAGEIEPGVVAHHWLIRGTSSGKEL